MLMSRIKSIPEGLPENEVGRRRLDRTPATANVEYVVQTEKREREKERVSRVSTYINLLQLDLN